VYSSGDPAAFHRGWPGVGFTHSLLFGVFFATVILAGGPAKAAPPAAPDVTAGAEYNVLRLDWDPVTQSSY
jgi:hypothetical protein